MQHKGLIFFLIFYSILSITLHFYSGLDMFWWYMHLPILGLVAFLCGRYDERREKNCSE